MLTRQCRCPVHHSFGVPFPATPPHLTPPHPPLCPRPPRLPLTYHPCSFNFSHGSHADHQAVLDRVRKVAGEMDSSIALMLDTKGPEIRTAMLRGHKDIQLEVCVWGWVV